MAGIIRYIFLSLLFIFPLILCGLNEAAVWYFGWNAGLDFNKGSPGIIHGGQIHTIEGVASIIQM